MDLKKCKAVEDIWSHSDVDLKSYDDSIEDLKYESKIESYDDYLFNKKNIEEKRRRCFDALSYFQKQEDDNKKKLKTIFLSQFLDGNKTIKGMCLQNLSQKNGYDKDSYIYINGLSKNHPIGEGGLNVSCVHVQIANNENQNIKSSIHIIENYYIKYEDFFLKQIEQSEFMEAYEQANLGIIEALGLNKVEYI